MFFKIGVLRNFKIFAGNFQFSKFYNINRALEPNIPGIEYAAMI